MKRFGVLAAVALAAVFVNSAGAGLEKADLSTRAGVTQYLVAHGIDPTGVVIQRGARNYAGPSCPGRGWSCTHASRVVQISSGSANQYQCTPSSGGLVAPPNTCTIVQMSTSGTNDARCTERSNDPSAAQSCVIQQENVSGDNRADIQQSVDVGDSPASDVSQDASVDQSNGSGSNSAQVTQNLNQSSKSPDTGGSQSQEGHQTVTVTQTSDTGDNRSDVNQSLAQSADTKAGPDNLTQTQNALDNGPNTDASVDQTTTLGRNESHLNQSNDLKMFSKKVGNVMQTQGSGNGGLNGHVDQSSSGLSFAFASQDEKQKVDADKSVSLSQTQIGPSWCCSVQVSNPGDRFQISQRSQQFADDGAAQSNAVVGTCDTSGNCTVDQRIQQGSTMTTNSCSGPFCNTGIVCSEGECAPCTGESCPPPPCEDCSFGPSARQPAASAPVRAVVRRMR
jgi:hypothetical protein